MHRREFLKSTGAAAAGAGVLAATMDAAPAVAADAAAVPVANGQISYTLGTAAEDNGRGTADSARRLARRIELLTGGKIRFEVVSTGPGVADAGVRFDMWHGPVTEGFAGIGAQEAAFSYFSGLPGRTGLSLPDLQAWLAMGGGQDLWDDLAAPYDFKPLLAAHTGARPVVWSRPGGEAISGSLRGVRFAGTGLAAEVAHGLGATPVAIKTSGLVTSMADGIVDAAEGPGIVHALALGLPDVATFAHDWNINRHGVGHAFMVRSAVWTTLTASEQAAIVTAAAEEVRLTYDEARLHQAIAWRVASERHGVVVHTARPELLASTEGVSDAVIAHVAASSRAARRIDASYMAFREMLGSSTAQPPVV